MTQITNYVQDRLQHVTNFAPGMKPLNLQEVQDTASAATASAMTTAAQATQAAMHGSFEQLNHIADMIKKNRFVDDLKLVSMIPGALISALSGSGMDDRKLLMEQVIAILSSLPPTSMVSKAISNTLISVIWADLPHPPGTLMGKVLRYRSADGSANNVFDPVLGAANQPYSRNVTRTHPEPVNLPDPGTVFDLLLARDNFVSHPSGISSLLFHFANIIIHDIFWTRHEDASINQHSSYLDLQSVYGNSEEVQQSVRAGRLGLLKPDTIADWRLAMMPPATAALAVLFSRCHNYIATRLLEVNERNRFDGLSDEELDEELFGKARLVNCGMFINIILRNYIPVILNIPTSDYFVNPLPEIRNVGGPGKLERGVGNSVASEFSVMYRWHSTISTADADWTENLIRSLVPPGTRPEDLTDKDFREVAGKIKEQYDNTEPSEWVIHGWPRDEEGKFSDDLLAKIVKDATTEVAGAFRACGTPVWFRAIDMLGQVQARETWALCTINEFRAFLGLKEFKSFTEWNEDKEIAKKAEMLYGHIDNLELFPGLHAEQAKPSITGSGLCPGYTISRAILSDAAALTRGDRFYTTDFSTSNLTSYGYEFCNTPQPGSKGMIGKFLMATLPGQFPYNSIYALYPFNVPNKTAEFLKKDGSLEHYDTAYPSKQRRWISVESYSLCKEALTNDRYMTVLPRTTYDQAGMLAALYAIPRWKEEIAKHYHESMVKAIETNVVNYNRDGTTKLLDIVEVANIASAQFTADLFALPMHHEGGLGGMTPSELHLALARTLAFDLAGSFSFLGRHSWRLEEQSESASHDLMMLLRARVYSMMKLFAPIIFVLQGISHLFKGPDNISPGPMAKHFYSHLFTLTRRYEEIVHDCFQMMVSMTSLQTLIVMRAIQWLLNPENSEILARLHRLALRTDASSQTDFRSHFLEACRLSCLTPLPAHFCVGSVAIPDDSGNTVQLQSGDGVFISADAVYRDPRAYRNPTSFDPQNAANLTFGLGDQPSQAILDVALPAIGQEILKLRNLRLAKSGQPQTVSEKGPGDKTKLLLFVGSTGQENPLPLQTAMHVLYDTARS